MRRLGCTVLALSGLLGCQTGNVDKPQFSADGNVLAFKDSDYDTVYLVDEHGWKRKKAVFLTAGLAFLLGIPSALSFGSSAWLSKLPLLKVGFLDLANIVMGNYSLTIGALFISLFVAYKWGVKAAAAEIELEGNQFYYKSWWSFIIRYICPVAILGIFIYIILTGDYS